MKTTIITIKQGLRLLAALGFGAVITTAVNADISGTVYQDLAVDGSTLNTYGIKDGNELGVANIKVTVIDSSGNIVGAPVVTDTNGDWTVANTSGNLRVEFTDIPSYLKSSPANTGSNTTVQFVSDLATNVDLGLHEPADYSDTAVPEVVLTSWVGDTSTAGGTTPTHFSFPFDRNGQNEDDTFDDDATRPIKPIKAPAPTTDATAAQTGSTWGLAYQKNQERYFSATAVRRHSGLAATTGTIFVIDKSGGSASLAHQFDLNGVVTASGGTIDLGSLCRGGACKDDLGNTGIDSDYVIAAPRSIDLDAAKKVGKIAFGDIDMEPQTDNLWAVNLHQRALVKIDVGNDNAVSLPGSVDQFLISGLNNVPTCNNGELRPWGLNFSQGKGYLGLACDASNGGTTSDLTGYVVSFDPNDITSGFTDEVSFPLGFTRNAFPNAETVSNATMNAQYDFAPWSHTWADFRLRSPNKYTLPQAIVSDIEFDKSGNMNIALIDRAGLQLGVSNYPPVSGSVLIVKSVSRGDIFHACKTAVGFEMEGSGSCPVHSFNFTGTGNFYAGNIYDNDSQGLQQNGEFFEDQAGDDDREGALGALAMLKGSNKMVMTIIDPHPTNDVSQFYWSSQGVNFVDPVNGDIEQYYALYHSEITSEFGKASGIGDVELLTAPAPIEIGNRVWKDGNGNGVQDAGETGIAGVIVQLLDQAGNPVQVGGIDVEAITDANGNYIFSSDPAGTSTGSHIYQITGLSVNTAYTIRIPNAGGGAQQPALSPNRLTLANASIGTDINDSDGFVANIIDAEISVLPTALPGPGANNHSFDFGFSELSPVCINHELNWKPYTQFNDDSATNYPFTSEITDLDGSTLDISVEMPRAGMDFKHVGFPNTTFPGIVDQYMTNAEVYRYWKQNDDTIDTLTYDFSEDVTFGKFMFGGHRPSAGNFAYAELTFWDGSNGTGNKVTSKHSSGAGSAVVLGAVGDPTTAAINVLPLSALNNYASTFLSDEDSYTMVTYDVGASPQPWTVLDMGGAVVRSMTWTIYGSDVDVSPHLAGSGSAGDESLDVSVARDNVLAMNISAYIGNFNFDTCEKVAVGNVLFYDNGSGAGTANDGIKAGSEPGVPAGVKVDLYDNANALITTTLTDTNGRYYFDNIEQGSYYVKVPASEFGAGKALDGYLSSTAADSGETDDVQENGIDDASPATNGIISNTFYVAAGYQPIAPNDDQTDYSGSLPDENVNATYDFGFHTLEVSIGSLVWEDRNQDGIQGTAAAEPRIEGAKVNLLVKDGSGNFIQAKDLDNVDVAEFTTLANGQYYFDNLPEGEYKVTVNVPSSYKASSTQNANANDDGVDDSNIETTVGTLYTSGAVILSAGTEPSEVGGFDGDEKDDDLIETNGNTTVDFGFLPLASIGDKVWYDDNRDGIQDAGEDGVPNVKVYLLDENGNRVQDGGADKFVTSSATGIYLFNNLEPGDYSVEFDLSTLPVGGYVVSPVGVGNNADADSDANTTSGKTTKTTLDPAESDLSWDMGIYKPVVSLGSVIWNDKNNNGMQDSDESGIIDAIVTLLDGNGVAVPNTPIIITDSTGNYFFDNLPEGDYQVQVDMSGTTGFSASTTQVGDPNNNANNDSNIAMTAGQIHTSGTISLLNGAEPEGVAEVSPLQSNGDARDDSSGDSNGNMTLDLGFYSTVRIGDVVWIENDNDGDRGTGDITYPAAGTIVTATALDGTTYTGTTDANGNYAIDVPEDDTYVVTVATLVSHVPALGSGDNTEVPADTSEDDISHNGVLGTTVVITTEDNLTLDFGFVQSVKIGNLIWFEDDNNGVADGEMTYPPLGTIVTATASDGITTYTGTTDDSGNYFIVVPINDEYMVTIPPPSGYVPTTGSDDSEVPDDTSEDNNSHNGTGTKVIIGTSDNTSVDFAFTLSGAPGEPGSEEAIPTLSEWALIMLMMLLGFVGYQQGLVRRRH